VCPPSGAQDPRGLDRSPFLLSTSSLLGFVPAAPDCSATTQEATMSRNKTILITGSSSRIGRATAKLFAKRGWNVIATMRHPERDTELYGVAGITTYPLDVANLGHVKLVAQKFGAMTDVVHNNAGYRMVGPIEGVSDEQIVSLHDTSLMCAERMTRAFLPFFKDKRAGLFVNMVPIAEMRSLPFGISIKTVLPTGGSPVAIAEVVFEAATDDKDKLNYFASGAVPSAHAME
jgi:NAD(P)-dependent dehydrogenase (short-subunit alcohol dehydrogenase family)